MGSQGLERSTQFWVWLFLWLWGVTEGRQGYREGSCVPMQVNWASGEEARTWVLWVILSGEKDSTGRSLGSQSLD